MDTIPMPTMDTTTMARGLLMLMLSPDMPTDMLPMLMDMPTMAMDTIPMPTTMARGLLKLMLSPDMDTMATTDIPMPTTTTRGPLMPSLDMDMPMDTPMPIMAMPTTDITTDTIINLLNNC